MDPQTKAAFEKLLCQKANKTCVDCDTYNPQWASVSNGIFMCIKCAGIHRSLGVHITFVRSVTMDSWSKMQLARMKCGGNAKLRKFWKDQKFPSNLSTKEKYDNEAMEKWRANLLASAKDENPPKIPFIGYKANVIAPQRKRPSQSSMGNNGQNGHNSGYNGNSGSNSSGSSNSSMSSMGSGGFGNYDPNEQQNNQMNDVLNGFSTWTSTFAAKTSVIASDFASKSKQVASQLSEKAAAQASEIKTKVNDPNFQSGIKDSANQGWSAMSGWLTSATSTVSKQVSTLYNEAQNSAGAGSSDEPVSLYNKNEIDRTKKPSDAKYTNDKAAFSSEQWFESHPSKYAKNAISSDTYFNGNGSKNSSNNSNSNNSNTLNSNSNDASKASSKGINKARNSSYGASDIMDSINDDVDNLTIDEHDDQLHTPKSGESPDPTDDNETNDTFDDGWGFDDDIEDNESQGKKAKGKAKGKGKMLPKGELPKEDDDDMDDLLNIDEIEPKSSNMPKKDATQSGKPNDDGGNGHEGDEWGW